MIHVSADLVIRNGTLVTATDTFRADLAVSGEQITAIGDGLAAPDAAEIDATGLLVVPGGIDAHVHLQYPQGPQRVVSSDDWFTGTVAAACGGTTTVIDFVEARPEQSWMQAFETRLGEAAPQAVIDYGFHMAFNRADAASLAEVAAVVAAGMPSFKIYMAYDGIRLTDAEMLRALEQLKTNGALPIVHAENHDVIKHLTAGHLAAGRYEPRWHPSTRPAAAEAEATQRALTFAGLVGVPMHIVHVSARLGLVAMREFSGRGQVVTGEVCPQHLLLTADLYEQDGFGPARYIMAPPLRDRTDCSALWQALAAGDIDCVVTDHCPFTLTQKRGERRTPGFRRRPDGTAVECEPEPAWSDGLPAFNQVPGGAPGIETRVPLLYHHGVIERRLSLNQFVNVTSTAIARRFGLYPRKGTLAPGADADLVLFDPDLDVTISAAGLHQNCDYTPYEGWRLGGWPRTVLSRGRVIVRDGQFVGAAGEGRYVKRSLL
jgi:dihydropyrimidinase